MSVDSKQQQPVPERIKVIGFKVTERELQNTIYPIMHDCYRLGILSIMIPWHRSYGLLHPVLDWALPYEAAVRFKPSRDRAGREEKACNYRCREGGVWEVYTARHTAGHKKVEEIGEQLERDFKETHPPLLQPEDRPKPKQQQSPIFHQCHQKKD